MLFNLLKRSFLLLLAGSSLLGLNSCYQAHSDDDLRTVPATNNPNLIHDSNRHTVMTGPTH